MSRTITVLGLLQTLLVILGFFGLAAVLKLSGYPDFPFVRWNPVAVFLREHGLLLLLLPVLWTAFAAVAQRVERDLLSSRAALMAGGGLALIIIALFIYAAVAPFTRPLIMHL